MVLPEIVKMFAEREREEKRKLMMMAPKRTSNRIERKRRDQEERDRLMAEKVNLNFQPFVFIGLCTQILISEKFITQTTTFFLFHDINN